MIKKLLSILILGVFVIGFCLPSKSNAQVFSDLPDDEYGQALEKAVENGLLQGTEGLILPEDSLTRAQLGAILVRAFGAEEKADLSSFADISKEAWYYDELSRAVAMGLLNGYDDSTLRPDNEISRVEAFVVLSRAFNIKGGISSVLSQFDDGYQVPTWARPEVSSLIAEGYIQGGDGILNPNASIKRKDFALIMGRISDTYVNKAEIYENLSCTNLVISASGATIKNSELTDKIILAEGASSGKVRADKLSCDSIFVRGIGNGSLSLKNNAKIATIEIAKSSGSYEISFDNSSKVDKIIISSENVSINGINEETELVFKNGVTKATVNGKEYIEEKELTEMTLSVFGDIVVHEGIYGEAKKADGSYDFSPIFDGAKASTAASDFSICTFEGSFPEVKNYHGYPMFQTPAELAQGLADAGFDLVNTASNHCMDGWKSGLDRVLDKLDEAGVSHVGTYRTEEERNENNGIVVKEFNGISIAFMSYTYGTNGMYIGDDPYSVNLLYSDYLDLPQGDIDYEGLKADLAAARELNTDFIAVQLHWGYEYHLEPIPHQEELADFFFEQGVDLILGSHPHVPEPMELRKVVDIEGNEKTGYIVYSIGNFVANMMDDYENLSACINITLEKDLTTQEGYIKHISYKPLIMLDLWRYGVAPDGFRYKVCDLRDYIERYQAGENPLANDYLVSGFEQKLDMLHKVFDESFDEINGGVDVVAWSENN